MLNFGRGNKSNWRRSWEQRERIREGTNQLDLKENDIILINTDDPEFSGKYRIIGKSISFGSSFSIKLTINRRPPVLSEYLASLDN